MTLAESLPLLAVHFREIALAEFFFVIFQAKNCITFHLKFQVSIYFLKCRSFRVRSGAEAIFQPIASP